MQLISDEYREQQKRLHDGLVIGGQPTIYGGAAKLYAPLVAQMIDKLEPSHILDYGCGRHLVLPQALKDLGVRRPFKYQAYDPAVERFAGAPIPAEMVVCIDVLEHIEEDCIDDVLDHLESLTEAVGLFTIDTGPAMKSLPDGRNAHILQRPPEWWLPRLMCRFDLQTFQMTHAHKFYVVVHAKPAAIEDSDGKAIRA